MVLFVYWGHQSALFLFLRGQQIEELRFLGRCDLKVCLCLLELRSEIGDLIVLYCDNLCAVMPGHCLAIALFS